MTGRHRFLAMPLPPHPNPIEDILRRVERENGVDGETIDHRPSYVVPEHSVGW